MLDGQSTRRATLLAAAGALLVFSVSACASGGAASPPATGTDRQRSSSSILTADEIAKTGQSNAYHAIQSSRPQWLRARPLGSSRGGFAAIQVYLEGARYGTASSLQQIPAISIREIRYLDALEATTRFGTEHGSGAILVFLKR